MIKKFIVTSAITTLLLLASVGGYFVVTSWLSLYDYGRVVLAVSITGSIFGFLALAAKGTPLPFVKGQEGHILQRPSWVDNVPAVIVGCILGIATGYLIMTASINLGLRPARSQSVPYVLSLRANLPDLEKKAFSWKNDAYLVSATIYLKDDDLWLISTHFKSPSMSSQSLIVNLTPEYSLERVYINGKTPVQQEEPIQEEYLGSQAALRAFGLNDEIRYCLNSTEKLGDRLTLERRWTGEETPLLWTLVFDACPRSGGRTHHIDAVTGEVVDIKQ